MKRISALVVFCVLLLVMSTVGSVSMAVYEDDPGLSDYDREPMPEALEALESDENVTVTEKEDEHDQIVFDPVEEDPDIGMVFGSGGEVDPRAYAPAAREIAEEGYFVVLFYPPLGMPDGGPFGDVIADHPEIEEWSVGGHSNGGMMACEYFDDDGYEDPEGLHLWAAYPNPGIGPIGGTDLSDKEGEFISIYGTEDEITTPGDIEDSKENLPDDTDFVEIEGGNHAQFGYYGEQDGDGEATISREEQQDITIDATLDHLNTIKGVEEYELNIDAEEGGTTDPEPGVHTYEEGEEVIVSAIPDEGHRFSEWTGDHESTEKEIMITMDSDKHITAQFEEDDDGVETYELTIDIDGEGTTDPEEGTHTYDEDEDVTITAMPSPGWDFEEWSGDVSDTDEEITVTMDSDKHITAHFEDDEDTETYELTTDTEGEGTVHVDPEEDQYVEGTEVTLTAMPEDGWSFVEWTGDVAGTDSTIEITMDDDKSVTAVFEEAFVQYDLTIDVEGEGSTEPEEGIHTYEEDETVTVTATPADGWVFDEWTGDVAGTDSTIEITMDEDKSVTAVFEEEIVEYELSIDVEGQGSTEPEEGTHTYEEDETVTVTATPADGWVFDEWTGDETGTGTSIDFVMNEDKSITAVFEEETVEYELTIDVEGQGSADPEEGTHTYEEDDEVTVTATAEEGWAFVEWTGDQEGTEEEITLIMDDDKEITAHFEEVVYYELDVHIEGQGEVEVDPDEEEYEEGTEVTLIAIPEEGWNFEEWTGDNEMTEEEITITMDDDKEITAWFEEEVVEYELTITVEGEGTTEPSTGTHAYEEGEEVTITATPDEDWEFDEWSGDTTSDEMTIDITMDGDKEITANFSEEDDDSPGFTSALLLLAAVVAIAVYYKKKR